MTRNKIERIERFFDGYRRIAIYQYFADLVDTTRMIYLAWLYLTIAVILSIPFIPIELLIMMPLSRYNRHLRKKARAEHFSESRKGQGK